ncbi:hypothetical protein D3C85_1516370 [compost metagenome]
MAELAVRRVLCTSSSATFTSGSVWPLNCLRLARSSRKLPSRLPAMLSSGSLAMRSTTRCSCSCNCSRLPGKVGMVIGSAVLSKATLGASG